MVQKHFEEDSLCVHGLMQGAARAKMMASDGVLETSFVRRSAQRRNYGHFINRDSVVGSSGKVDRWVQCRKRFPYISQLAHVYKSFLQAKSLFVSDFDLAELLTEAAWCVCLFCTNNPSLMAQGINTRIRILMKQPRLKIRHIGLPGSTRRYSPAALYMGVSCGLQRKHGNSRRFSIMPRFASRLKKPLITKIEKPLQRLPLRITIWVWRTQ